MIQIVFGMVLPWILVGVLCWLVVQLIQQNGRILHRLEAIEDRIGTASALPSASNTPSNRIELKYRSPESGSTTTIVLPAFSGRFPIRTATAAAAPLEIPERIPSSRVSRRAKSIASSLLICSIPSTSDISNTGGTNPAPMP